MNNETCVNRGRQYVRVLETTVTRHLVCAFCSKRMSPFALFRKTSWNGPDCAEGHALVHSLDGNVELDEFEVVPTEIEVEPVDADVVPVEVP